MIKVKIDIPKPVDAMIIYIWHVFADYIGFPTAVCEENEDILISMNEKADIRVSSKFIDNISSKHFAHQFYFDAIPAIQHEDGAIDYLGSCFYIINCIQEYAAQKTDTVGRFPYAESFQHKFKCIEKPLVNHYFEALYNQLSIVKENFDLPRKKSVVFLSHDIDSLYRSKYQDGFYALKTMNVGGVLQIILNELRGRPAFFNMRGIVRLLEKYNAKSTFFWLVNRGLASTEFVGKKIKNSDYDINNKRVREVMSWIAERGFENGVHKSISRDSYDQEIEKLGVACVSNRNHYLRFQLPEHFNLLEESAIQIDYSLGFAETPGFRNGYSLPFNPYNFTTQQPYEIMIVPLHVMDTTFRVYMKLPLSETKARIHEFVRANQYNAVLNILWHNSYFTPYKYGGYKEIFESVLELLGELGVESVLSDDILSETQ